MIVLKAIFYAIVGLLAGYLVSFVVWLIAYSVFGMQWGGKAQVVIWSVFPNLGLVIGIPMGFMYQFKKEADERTKEQARLAEEERRRHQAQEAAARRQQEYRESELKQRINSLADLLSNSKGNFLDLRELIPAAEEQLDRAEEAFGEHAYSPFWDEIENATSSLITYQRGIELINGSAIAYRTEAAVLPTSIPPFDIPTRQLPDGRPTATRLAAALRKAQRDDKFELIYQHRKTNEILVAGFGTLTSAINAIPNSIAISLENLSFNFDTSLDKLLTETREHSRQAQLAANRHIDTIVDQSKRAAADTGARRKFEQGVALRQEEQTRMLNNIQRGRKPFP